MQKTAAAPAPSAGLPDGRRAATSLRVKRKLVRRPLAEQIKEELLEGILTGRIPPDTRLVELQLARELGTSQAPVREALRGLEALGVVEISPYRGSRVRHPSTDEILEAYAVRTELESLGARLALLRLTADDLDELESYVAEMQRAAIARDPHAVAVADASFHSRILEIGGNKTLCRVWRSLEPFSRTLITLVMPGADPEKTASLHVPIIEALRAGDGNLASEALRHHFADAEQLARKVWSESESGGRPDARQSTPSDSSTGR